MNLENLFILDYFKDLEYLSYFSNMVSFNLLKTHFTDFFFKLSDHIDKIINSEKIIYLEKLSVQLKSENILLINKLKEVESSLNISSEDFINKFWFSLFLVSLLILLVYILIFSLKYFFKNILENNPILKFIFPNKYTELKIKLKELKKIINKYEINIYNNNNLLNDSIRNLTHNVLQIKELKKEIDKFPEKKSLILNSYKNSLNTLKSYLDSSTKKIYNSDEIKDISKFYLNFINKYNILFQMNFTFANAMFGNFVEYLRVLEKYEQSVEIVKSKYTAISMLEFCANWKFFEEEDYLIIMRDIHKIKNNSSGLEYLMNIYKKKNYEHQNNVKMTVMNREFLRTMFLKNNNIPEVNNINVLHGKLVYHLKNFKENYYNYIKNYKNTLSLNKILKEEMSLLKDKDLLKSKVREIDNIQLNIFKPFSFKPEPIKKEELLEQKKLIEKTYFNTQINVEKPLLLFDEKNTEYNSIFKSILETDLYKDTKFGDYEGPFDLL